MTKTIEYFKTKYDKINNYLYKYNHGYEIKKNLL